MLDVESLTVQAQAAELDTFKRVEEQVRSPLAPALKYCSTRRRMRAVWAQ